MKKLNTTYLDNLVSKILKETLEERADSLVSKIKGNVCECGGTMYEGECNECGSKSGDMYEDSQLIGKQKNIDVAEPKGKITSDDLKKLRNSKISKVGKEYGGRHGMEEGIYDVEDINKKNEFDYVEESGVFENSKEDKEKTCRYHIDNFGEDDPVTQEVCQGVNLRESLKGRQSRLDKNKNNKIDAEDFKMLRKGETSEQKLIDRKGSDSSFKRYCNGEVTKSCIDKALKSGSESLVKKAKNIKGYKGADKKKIKESYQLSESEMVGLIEKIVLEQKNKEVKDPAEKNNIKGMGGSPRGLEVYKKAHKGSGKENDDYIKDVTKKMKDYLKDGSKGEYDMNPKTFPVGNGELEKMDKKAFQMTDDLEDFNYEIAGLNLPTPDAIEFNEDFMEKLYKGDSTTGNAPGGNALESKSNDRFNKLRKKNTLKKLKDQSYNRVSQPVFNEKSGTEKGKGVSIKLESTEDKKTKQINEEFDRMKSLMGYSQKTQ